MSWRIRWKIFLICMCHKTLKMLSWFIGRLGILFCWNILTPSGLGHIGNTLHSLEVFFCSPCCLCIIYFQKSSKNLSIYSSWTLLSEGYFISPFPAKDKSLLYINYFEVNGDKLCTLHCGMLSFWLSFQYIFCHLLPRVDCRFLFLKCSTAVYEYSNRNGGNLSEQVFPRLLYN